MSHLDHERLFQIASQQGGYFTATQARQAGFTRYLIRHHVRHGRFERIRRGLYRLHQYVPSPDDHIIEAFLSAGPRAVVSHESALSLHRLSDVVPATVHLTVPRTHRYVKRRVPEGVTIHTTARSVRRGDFVPRGPLRVTAPARSVIDAAEAGTAPEQIALAVRQALDRGLTTPKQLLILAAERSRRVADLVRHVIEEAQVT